MRLTFPFQGVARAIFAGLAFLGTNATSLAQSTTDSSPATVTDPRAVQPLPGSEAIERLTSPMDPCACAIEDAPQAPPSFGGPILERQKLSGDWFGCRTRLRDCGITIDVSTTQFYQGVANGGLSESFAYGGRNDYFLNVNGEKFGLWRGFHMNLHGETRYGDSTNFRTGALSPVNFYLKVPDATGTVSGITALKFTQFLGENVMVYAGKINTLDEVQQPLTGATGIEGFWNTGLIFNLAYALTVPYSTFGAGVVYMKDQHPVLALAVLDTNESPNRSVFDTLFNNGATIFGVANLPTQFFGRPGHQGFSGTYSSGRYNSLKPSSYLDPITGLVASAPLKSGSWSLAYNFDQAVWVSPSDPKRMWGVFGHLGLTDGNPNPVRWFANTGISGASPLPGRNADTFGVGYYFMGVSGTLKRTALPSSPLRNEQGVELFYNARVTPWCQITPDLQIVDPFQKPAKTALLVGVRAKLDF
jgi:porin